MGGMGFISVAECEVLCNNALNQLETRRQGDRETRRQEKAAPPLLVSPNGST
jgi:hypothetical protein